MSILDCNSKVAQLCGFFEFSSYSDAVVPLRLLGNLGHWSRFEIRSSSLESVLCERACESLERKLVLKRVALTLSAVWSACCQGE